MRGRPRFLRLTAALVSFIKETSTNKLSISDYTFFFPVVSTSFVSVFESRVNFLHFEMLPSFPLISFIQKSFFTKFALVGSNSR